MAEQKYGLGTGAPPPRYLGLPPPQPGTLAYRFQGPGTVEEYESAQMTAPTEAKTQAKTKKKTPLDLAKEYFASRGADLQDYRVLGVLEGFEAVPDDITDVQFQMMLHGAEQYLIQEGAIVVTAYEQAQERSGFGTGPVPFPVEPVEGFGELDPRLQAAERSLGGVPLVPTGGPAVQERTEWQKYPNGVMVEPGHAIGDPTSIAYPPSSTAPGSRGYFLNAQESWSQDKINDWRKKLVEQGYLAKGQEKGVWDVPLQNALTQYFTVKYQNGGTAMPWDSAAAAGGTLTPFNFRKIRGQVENDVKLQYQRIFGDDPNEAELQEWADFIVETSSRLYKSGQFAPGQATAEAEERFVQRLEESPEAQFVIQNLEENTELRDSMLRAVTVAQGLV